jgi:N-acetyltransferase
VEPLLGRFVRLDLLVASDAPLLGAAVASVDRASFAWAPVPAVDPALPGFTSADETVGLRLSQADSGAWIPFVQRRVADGAVVGMTNYLGIERWIPGGPPSVVEIGGTWLLPSAQGTAINTEAKLLLLTHAFDVWKVVRVQIKTDARNERSRAAILRLGASFEGILRNFQPGAGERGTGAPRNTAMYSVTDADWPEVRRLLTARLDDAGTHEGNSR